MATEISQTEGKTQRDGAWLKDFQAATLRELEQGLEFNTPEMLHKLMETYRAGHNSESEVARAQRMEQITLAPVLWMLTQHIPEQKNVTHYAEIVHQLLTSAGQSKMLMRRCLLGDQDFGLPEDDPRALLLKEFRELRAELFAEMHRLFEASKTSTTTSAPS